MSHAAGYRGGRQVQVHFGQQVGLAAGLLEIWLCVGRQRGAAPLDHLQARILFLQRLLFLQQLLVSLFERRVSGGGLVVVGGGEVGGVRQEGGVGMAARWRGGRGGRGEGRPRGGARWWRRRCAARGHGEQFRVALGHGWLWRVLAARAHRRRGVRVAAAGVRVQAPQRALPSPAPLRWLRERLQLI